MIVLIGATIAVTPLLPAGLVPTHDGVGHLYRLMDFDLIVQSGDLWPRVAPHLAQDFGYATFTFYSPLSLYLGEAFRLLGLGYMTSLKAEFALSIFASSLGAFLLGRAIYGIRGAVATGVVYVLLPYHLLDIYTRGDVAESLGLAILPFVFWGFWRVGRRPSLQNIVLAGGALAALIVAHNLTALFATPLLLGFVLVMVGKRWNVGRLVGFGASGLFALILAGAYWVPVLIESSTINAAALTTGFFDYHQRFFTLRDLLQNGWAYNYQYNPAQDIVFNLSPIQAAAIVASAVYVLVAPLQNRRVLVGSVIAIGFLLWLEQDGSAWFWDQLPMMRYLQFPYRLSIYITLATAVVIGAVASSPRPAVRGDEPKSRSGPAWNVGGVLLSAVAIAGISAASFWHIPTARTPELESQVTLPTLWRVEQDRQLIATSTQGDFIPRWTEDDLYRPGAPFTQPPPGSQEGSPAVVTANVIGPLDFNATVDALEPSTLTFDRIYYESWQATIDAQPAPLAPVGKLGLISLEVPAGTHEIHLSADGTPLERAGLFLSLVAVSATAAFLVWPTRKRGYWRLGGFGVALTLIALTVAARTHPSRQLAGGITFGDSVRLVGSALSSSTDSAGATNLTLIWEPIGKIPSSCETSVRVLSSSGQVIATREKVPLFGLRPCSLWQSGTLVHDEVQIRLPSGVPAGSYRLVVGFTADGHDLPPNPSSAPIDWRDDAGTSGRGALLGTADLPAYPVATPTPFGSPVNANVANRFELESAAVSIATDPSQPSAGDNRFVGRLGGGSTLSVNLLWRSLSDVSIDYSVFTHLIDSQDSAVAQDDAWPDRFNSPTSVWIPGDRRHDTYQILVPPTITPGIYRLVTGAYDRLDQTRLKVISGGIPGDQVLLGRFKVTGTDQIFGDPTDMTPRSDVFGGIISLSGFRLPSTALEPGGKIRIGLEWKALRRPPVDYTVFVHLLGTGDRAVAQSDSMPLGGTFRTSDWDLGDTTFDVDEINLPNDLPVGSYTVEVGLYDAATGERLPVTNGETSIRLGTLRTVGG